MDRYAGMYGDDLAKSPHMARIAGSVYDDINPAEFYFDQSVSTPPPHTHTHTPHAFAAAAAAHAPEAMARFLPCP